MDKNFLDALSIWHIRDAHKAELVEIVGEQDIDVSSTAYLGHK